VRTRKRTTKLGIKLLFSFAVVPVLVSSTLAITPWSASAQTSLRLPVSQGATQRFIVTVASRSDVAIIANEVEAAGATVDYRFTKVLTGFSASLTAAQAEALGADPRVLNINLDEKISLDSFATSTEIPAASGDVIPGRYIVTLKSTTNQSAKAGVLSILGTSVIAKFTEVFTGYTADLTPAQLAALESNPAVLNIEQDQIITINSDQSDPPWGLDRIDQSDLPLNQHYVDRSNGTGVTAYVVDTGIAPHTEFGNRLVVGRNYVGNLNGDLNYTDCNGHGTHVAGIIGSTTYGVAKRVTLVPVRVLDCNGNGTTSSVIAGVDWAVNNHVAGDPAVMNLSLGGAKSQALDNAVKRATVDGIVVAVAAGNDSQNACSYSPSREPSAITVGSSTRLDAVSSFSNIGSCVDLFAPGSAITSTWIKHPVTNAERTLTISGTSMASPHVAGAAAAIWGANLQATAATVTTATLSSTSLGKLSNAPCQSPNLLLYVNSQADPIAPLEDSLNTARAITGPNGKIASSIVGATSEMNEPAHARNTASHSVWFSYLAPSSGLLELNTRCSNFDTVLAVYTGSSMNTLAEVAFNDDEQSRKILTSAVQFSVTQGETYQIAVDGWNGAIGQVTLNWQLTLPIAPNAPSQVAAVTSRSRHAEITWNAPTHSIDSLPYTVTSYTVTASPGSTTCVWVQGPLACTFTNLSDGASYTFSVKATNILPSGPADSPASTSSNAIVPQTTNPVVTSAQSWGVDRVDQTSRVLDGKFTSTNRGSDSIVFIVDTGVSANSEFGQRLLPGRNFVLDNPPILDSANTADCHGHGTHVASTATGRSFGIANDALIVPVRVLNCQGEGTTTDLLASLEYIFNYPLNGKRAVVNISLGGSHDASLDVAITRLINKGIVVVVAAGNNGDSDILADRDACNYSPASAPSAITVGATTIDDARASFSNIGTCLDIFAPGTGIKGASIDPAFADATYSGTSMAAPHVAGAAAIALTALPLATPEQIANLLINNATSGILTDVDAGSPNRLLMVQMINPIISIAPSRFLDTRSSGIKIGQTDGTGTPYELTVAGVSGVPSTGVAAVAMNVTVVDGEATDVGGFVTVYPCGTRPDSSNLNFVNGQTVPNAVVAPVSPGGKVCFYVYGKAHLLADVSGYFTAGFSPLSAPTRLLDTRGSGNKVGKTDGSGIAYELTVAGGNGLPAAGTLGTVAMNVTVVDGKATDVGGYVTVYPCGTRPNSSNLNFVNGQTVPNAVIASVSSAGKVCFYVYGEAHILADVSGYFDSSLTALSAPARLLDTRGSGNKVGKIDGTGTPYELLVAGQGGIPSSGVAAVALNVTVVDGETSNLGGYVTVYPCGEKPDASNLNFVNGQTIPNSVITSLSTTGRICLYVYGKAHLLVDVSGYFSNVA
jgi:subtilisin family serine protease